MDKKEKEVEKDMPQRVPYAKAIKKNRKEAWLGARKRIDYSRLFGSVGGGPPYIYDDSQDEDENAQKQ